MNGFECIAGQDYLVFSDTPMTTRLDPETNQQFQRRIFLVDDSTHKVIWYSSLKKKGKGFTVDFPKIL